MPTIFQRDVVPKMIGASASRKGSAGSVPAPDTGDQSLFLRGDGTWAPTPAAAAALTANDLNLPFDPVAAFENAIG